MKTLLLYIVTAIAEILGCYLPYLVIVQNKTPLLWIPAAASLGCFAWLLTLHATPAGRTYAAYGGVYIAIALMWLWVVDGVRPTRWDATGVAIALFGMAIIVFQPK